MMHEKKSDDGAGMAAGFDSEIATCVEAARTVSDALCIFMQRAHPHFTNETPNDLPNCNECHYTLLLSILNAQRNYKGARNSSTSRDSSTRRRVDTLFFSQNKTDLRL